MKDLSKSLGRFCVVFNCSNGLDLHTINSYLLGLIQCGSWCCFDEFNRIETETLSVISQHLFELQKARAKQSKMITFNVGLSQALLFSFCRSIHSLRCIFRELRVLSLLTMVVLLL